MPPLISIAGLQLARNRSSPLRGYKDDRARHHARRGPVALFRSADPGHFRQAPPPLRACCQVTRAEP